MVVSLASEESPQQNEQEHSSNREAQAGGGESKGEKSEKATFLPSWRQQPPSYPSKLFQHKRPVVFYKKLSRPVERPLSR